MGLNEKNEEQHKYIQTVYTMSIRKKVRGSNSILYHVEMQIFEVFSSSSGVLMYKQFYLYLVDYDLYCYFILDLIAIYKITLFYLFRYHAVKKHHKFSDLDMYFLISPRLVDTMKKNSSLENYLLALHQCIEKHF